MVKQTMKNKEYTQWVESTGKYLRRWQSFTEEQKWFVFMNSRQVNGPKVSNITEPKPNMIWSRSK